MLDFDRAELVAKHRDWVRVQVAFYDFLFEAGSGLGADEFNSQGAFADGMEAYERATDNIGRRWPTASAAWSAFVAQELGN